MGQALKRQVGGDHYQHLPIQPIEFAEANELSACEANVVKYVCRWRHKNSGDGSVQDLRKAIHYLELLIDIELNKDRRVQTTEDTWRREHQFAPFTEDNACD